MLFLEIFFLLYLFLNLCDFFMSLILSEMGSM